MKQPLHRDIEEDISSFIDRDEIIIIRGPRQAGKTTLMEIIANSIKFKTVFVDMDVASNRNAISSSPIDYIKRLAGNDKLVLFLDEVQRLDDAGEKMKIIYDTFKGQVKIFASGSSSLEIRNKVLGFLVGRALLFELYTFGFGEFIRARDDALYRLFKEKNESLWGFIENGHPPSPASLSEDFLELWREYVVFGGYPEVVKEKDNPEVRKRLLLNLINLYIEKDIASFFKIEDTREFENFVRIVSFNDSQAVMLSSMAADANVSFYKAKSYLSILENTYITKLVYPYYRNATTSIRKTPKIYFLDLGLRNAVLKNMLPYSDRDDAGKIAENFVFTELLRRGLDIKYWRTKSGAEVDFVIEIDGKPVPIEVKLGGSKALGKSFYSFVETYKPKRALVITLNEFSKREVGGTTIYSIPIYYL